MLALGATAERLLPRVEMAITPHYSVVPQTISQAILEYAICQKGALLRACEKIETQSHFGVFFELFKIRPRHHSVLQLLTTGS